MKKAILLFFVLTSFLIYQPQKAFSSDNASDPKSFVPWGKFMLSGAPSEDKDNSKLYGAELQFNWRFNVPLSIGFHGLLQKQEYGTFDTNRWGLGLSLNYYMNFDKFTPYIGIKRTYYGGFGQKEEALDCLYCSDIEEDYSGGETFATIGTSINRWIFQIDVRISDERSEWSEDAYDPWGVGPTYNRDFDGIPDPEFIYSIGYSW